MLGTQCPNVLYPYARQTISDLIQAGGFPPFLLQPINFEVAVRRKPAPARRSRRRRRPGRHGDGRQRLTGTHG